MKNSKIDNNRSDSPTAKHNNSAISGRFDLLIIGPMGKNRDKFKYFEMFRFHSADCVTMVRQIS